MRLCVSETSQWFHIPTLKTVPCPGVNPVYGQGMTKAIMDGGSLNGILRTAKLEQDKQGSYRLPASFQQDMVKSQIPRTFGAWNSTRFSVCL